MCRRLLEARQRLIRRRAASTGEAASVGGDAIETAAPRARRPRRAAALRGVAQRLDPASLTACRVTRCSLRASPPDAGRRRSWSRALRHARATSPAISERRLGRRASWRGSGARARARSTGRTARRRRCRARRARRRLAAFMYANAAGLRESPLLEHRIALLVTSLVARLERRRRRRRRRAFTRRASASRLHLVGRVPRLELARAPGSARRRRRERRRRRRRRAAAWPIGAGTPPRPQRPCSVVRQSRRCLLVADVTRLAPGGRGGRCAACFARSAGEQWSIGRFCSTHLPRARRAHRPRAAPELFSRSTVAGAKPAAPSARTLANAFAAPPRRRAARARRLSSAAAPPAGRRLRRRRRRRARAAAVRGRPRPTPAARRPLSRGASNRTSSGLRPRATRSTRSDHLRLSAALGRRRVSRLSLVLRLRRRRRLPSAGLRGARAIGARSFSARGACSSPDRAPRRELEGLDRARGAATVRVGRPIVASPSRRACGGRCAGAARPSAAAITLTSAERHRRAWRASRRSRRAPRRDLAATGSERVARARDLARLVGDGAAARPRASARRRAASRASRRRSSSTHDRAAASPAVRAERLLEHRRPAATRAAGWHRRACAVCELRVVSRNERVCVAVDHRPRSGGRRLGTQLRRRAALALACCPAAQQPARSAQASRHCGVVHDRKPARAASSGRGTSLEAEDDAVCARRQRRATRSSRGATAAPRFERAEGSARASRRALASPVDGASLPSPPALPRASTHRHAPRARAAARRESRARAGRDAGSQPAVLGSARRHHALAER